MMQKPSTDGHSSKSASDHDKAGEASGDMQAEEVDVLLESLLFVANEEDLHASRASLTAGLPLVDGKLTPDQYVIAAQRIGLAASIVDRKLSHVSELVLPAVLLMNDNHALVCLDINEADNYTRVFDPVLGKVKSLTFTELAKSYSGYAIYTVPKPRFDARAGYVEEFRIAGKHWFWGVFAQSWRIYRDVLIASFLINLFVLANPLFVMNVYDRVVPNSAIETLWALALGIFILYVFDFVLKILRGYFIEVAGKKSDILLSSFILQRVLGAKYEDHPQSVGAFVSNLREFETVRSFITSTTIISCIDLPFVIIFLIAMAYIGGVLVWVPVALMPFILLYSWFAHFRLKKYVTSSFSASAQKNATLVESLTNLETVKTLNAEGSFLRKWEVAVGQLSKWGLRSRVLSQSASLFAGFVVQISSVLVIIVGVYTIAERELTQGALIACVILCGRVLSPLAQVSGLMVNYYQSKIALESLKNLVEKPQEFEATSRFLQEPVLKGGIEARKVRFAYPEESQLALDSVSLTIKPGERVAFIGKIGSGKSTIQKLFLGLFSPAKGNILLDSIDISQYNPVDIRNQIGYVSQSSELFFGSIRDNIMLGKVGYDDEELLRVSEIAGVSNWVNSHPHAYERNVGERGDALSGGQRQSLAIARALVGDPKILICDEPTSSMDHASEVHFMQHTTKVLNGKTLLLITHKMSLLAMVDRIIVMDRGRIVADGAKETVLDALKKGQLNGTS